MSVPVAVVLIEELVVQCYENHLLSQGHVISSDKNPLANAYTDKSL